MTRERKAKDERPTCLLCGKALAKTSRTASISMDTDPATLVGTIPEDYWPKPVVSIGRVSIGLMGKRLVNVWCGEYGCYGNGHFCTQACGFGWALRKLKMQAMPR